MVHLSMLNIKLALPNGTSFASIIQSNFLTLPTHPTHMYMNGIGLHKNKTPCMTPIQLAPTKIKNQEPIV